MPDTNETTATSRSADGTELAYSREGSGRPLVMIHCVGVSRATTPQPTLRSALAERATVFEYDRRGKGESGGGVLPREQVLDRELEDLAAIIDAAGGEADVYGFSSGATLALLAAKAGLPIRRLAILEPPLMPADDGTLRTELERILESDGPAAAHAWFMRAIVGVPDEVAAQLPPLGDEDLRNAPTLAHELTFLPGTEASDFAQLETPTLVILSDQTAPVIGECADALDAASDAIRAIRVPGSWHGVDDATLARTMADFLER